MQKRKLGSTGFEISPIGLGAWAMGGGGWAFGWGPQDDWRLTKNPEFQEPRLSRNLRLVEQLRAIGARHGRSPGEVAIAWTLRRPEVTGAIVGARRPSQVEGSIGAAEFRLSNEEIKEVERALAP